MQQYKPLVLAFISDASYNLYIKRKIIDSYIKVNDLQKQTAIYCSARFQAKLAKHLIENNMISESELLIFKQARNQKSHNAPKNTDILTYKTSTGFEAVWGYWYLNDDQNRMDEVWEIIKTIQE